MSILRGNREILQVAEVSVTLGAGRRRGVSTGNPVLQRVNLTIEAGSWTAIVGPNGAGKTTLLRACGDLLDRRDDREGRIDLMGKSLDHWSGRALAQNVAWLGTAEVGADGDLSALSAWDVVALGRLPHQRWWPSTGALTTDDAAVVQDVMMQTHTWQLRDKPLLEMSSGERQRVHIARALAGSCRILYQCASPTCTSVPSEVAFLRATFSFSSPRSPIYLCAYFRGQSMKVSYRWLPKGDSPENISRVLSSGCASASCRLNSSP